MPTRATWETVGQQLKSFILQTDGQVLFNIFFWNQKGRKKARKEKERERASIEGLKVKMGVDYLTVAASESHLH